MDYRYDVVNYDKNIPATIMRLNMTSDTFRTQFQWHREPELIYVVKGKIECSHNGELKNIEESGLVLLNSEDVYFVRPVKNTSCELVCIHLSFEYMRTFCKTVDNLFFDINRNKETLSELARIMKSIAAVDESSDEYASLLQISYVNKIYHLLLSNCVSFKRNPDSTTGAKKDFSYAKTAITYINENFRREIPLDEIAAVVNLSPSYFSKYFKNATQISFSEYLANLRLENAVNDMLNKNSNVSLAADENGFANVKSFITQCKKVYRCTPTQYKKKILKR